MKRAVHINAGIAVLMLLFACNTEDPLPVAAEFSTNIQDGTLETRQGFTLYLESTKGEFLTYFKGDTEETSWPDGYGTPFSTGNDSLLISGYVDEGTFTFTLVATSYGNWGETVEQDVQSIDINVVAPD